MMIFPIIELQNGRCVSLHRGRLDEPQIWHVDPVAKAKEFAAAGAEWLHVTDFDAIEGRESSRDIVESIIRHAGIPVQVAGGIRSVEGVSQWVEKGAGRAVIGTSAILAPDMVKEAAHKFPDQVVMSVDVFQGKVMSHGWRESSVFEPVPLLESFATDPLAAVIITDIDATIEDTDDTLSLMTQAAAVATQPVIARGLARTLDDLARIKYVPGIAGGMVGRGLFDKSIELADALALAAEPKGETARFQ